jgi:glycosyltransferase involved in cell wall biosynthesis
MPLNILLLSYCFSPDIGGIETISALLAREFIRAGHAVRVLTQTAADDGRAWPFQVVRCPSPRELLRHTAWCDVFFQNNISLQTAWAALFLRKPLVIAHQTWMTSTDGRVTWHTRLKQWVSRCATNIAISEAVARRIGAKAVQIGNPYDPETFMLLPGCVRDRSLVFLGRLVSDKGADVLLRALGLLRERNLTPSLTVIGGGPEDAALRALSAELGLGAQVNFAGALAGAPLAAMLNRHRILVVPSRWAEPFGIVALEGIACGCVVIGSEQGGLPSAIGPCGCTVPNGDAPALAAAIERVLGDGQLQAQYRAGAPEHLARHTVPSVAAAYLAVFDKAVR